MSPLYNKISSFYCYVGSHVTKSENRQFTAVKKQSERVSAGPARPWAPRPSPRPGHYLFTFKTQAVIAPFLVKNCVSTSAMYLNTCLTS